MTKDITPPPKKPANGGQSATNQNVRIDNFHYQANDIAELRKLAEIDPELARILIDEKKFEFNKNENTERFAITVTVLFALGILGSATFALINLGWIQSFLFIFAMLGASHILRVFLKGEFSDTGWLSQLLKLKKPPNDE